MPSPANPETSLPELLVFGYASVFRFLKRLIKVNMPLAIIYTLSAETTIQISLHGTAADTPVYWVARFLMMAMRVAMIYVTARYIRDLYLNEIQTGKLTYIRPHSTWTRGALLLVIYHACEWAQWTAHGFLMAAFALLARMSDQPAEQLGAHVIGVGLMAGAATIIGLLSTGLLATVAVLLAAHLTRPENGIRACFREIRPVLWRPTKLLGLGAGAFFIGWLVQLPFNEIVQGGAAYIKSHPGTGILDPYMAFLRLAELLCTIICQGGFLFCVFRYHYEPLFAQSRSHSVVGLPVRSPGNGDLDTSANKSA